MCPSDDIISAGETVNGCVIVLQPDPLNPGTNAVTFGWFTSGNTYDLGKTNYTGVAGALGDNVSANSAADGPGADLQLFAGLLTNRSSNKLANCKDGTSNTLLFGESLGSNLVKPRDYIWSWAGVGSLGTKFGLAPGSGGNTVAGGPICFSSRHTGVVNFAFADGSIKGLRQGSTGQRNPTSAGSDWYVLQSLAGQRDGYVLQNTLSGN